VEHSGAWTARSSPETPSFSLQSQAALGRQQVEQLFVIIGTVKGQSKIPFCSAMLSFLAV
jgi:hypothetical protein